MEHANVLATVRPTQIKVSCFGQEWELVQGPAAGWLGSIGYDIDGLAGVFPGRIQDNDLDRMWEASKSASNITETVRRWRNTARVAVQRGSGRDWWWTVNLTRRCLESWPYINGMLLLQGVDAENMRFPSWLDAAYMLHWQRQDEEGRAKLDLELGLPPIGVSPAQTPAAMLKMVEAFAAD